MKPKTKEGVPSLQLPDILTKPRVELLKMLGAEALDVRDKKAFTWAVSTLCLLFNIPTRDIADKLKPVRIETVSRWRNGSKFPPEYQRPIIINTIKEMAEAKLHKDSN